MLIIRKITHHKNSFNRKLQQPFEAVSLCKFMIVRGFSGLGAHNFFYILFHKTILKNTPP